MLLELTLFCCKECMLDPRFAAKRGSMQASEVQRAGRGSRRRAWSQGHPTQPLPPVCSALLQAELRSAGTAMRRLRRESVRTRALIASAALYSGMSAEALAAAREGLQLLEAQGGREPYHEALCCRIAAVALSTLGRGTRVPAGEVVALLERSKRAEAAAAAWLPPMLRKRLSEAALKPTREQQLRHAAVRGETLPGDDWAVPATAEGEDESFASLLASMAMPGGGGAAMFGGGAGALPPRSVDGLMQMLTGTFNNASGSGGAGAPGFGSPLLGLMAAMDRFQRIPGQGPSAAPRGTAASSPAGAQAPPTPPRPSEPAGMAFLEERLARCVAIPPAQRSPDVAGFVAGYRLADEVVAALPSLDAVAAGAPAVPRDTANLALLKLLVAQHISAGGLIHPATFKSRALRQVAGDLIEMGPMHGRNASGWSYFSVRVTGRRFGAVCGRRAAILSMPGRP